jgi:DNA-binding NarL/FixJ family response regulator
MPMHESQQGKKRFKLAIIEDCDLVLNVYLDKMSRVRSLDICTPTAISSEKQAIALMMREKPDIVITDLSLTSNHIEGFAILRKIRELLPDAIVAVSTSIYTPISHDALCERMRHEAEFVFHKADVAGMIRFLRHAIRELKNN